MTYGPRRTACEQMQKATSSTSLVARYSTAQSLLWHGGLSSDHLTPSQMLVKSATIERGVQLTFKQGSQTQQMDDIGADLGQQMMPI
jgi:hypothetical protein